MSAGPERGVGGAHSSDDPPIKWAGSEGALACVKPSQRNLELIGVPTPTTDHAAAELSFREAIRPPSLQELRQKLGRKAKQQKRYRFYSLYALVCRRDALPAALAAVARNDGAPGVAGTGEPVNALWNRRCRRKPDGGNLHVRFDEGEVPQRGLTTAVGSTPSWTPLYSTGGFTCLAFADAVRPGSCAVAP